MLRVVLIFTLLMNLIACSSAPEWKGIYGAEDKPQQSTKLDVPPDLTEPTASDSLALQNIVANDSTYLAYSNTGDTESNGDKIAAAKPPGIKVIRDGASQWLEINTTAEKLWPELKAFFTKIGFEIKREDKILGVMETNWLENRSALPSNWFSKILNRISSTGLRDKYRARLEKTDNPEVTRLFITHQGLKEHAADTSQDQAFKLWWESRPSDPELEAEMYQRFLVFSDVSRTESIKRVKKVAPKERAQIIEKDKTKMLLVDEGFARTWRRVGIALDRIGLFVEDRNRSSGLYYLKITDDFREKVKEDKDWLSSLFSKDESGKLKDRYLLNVSDENGTTLISIYETTGAKADSRFVNQLLNDLKSYLN